MDVLLTCVGKSDPYFMDYNSNEIPGPILTLLEERKFNVVHLLWSTDREMNQRAAAVQNEIKRRCGDRIAVNQNTFDAMDPTDLEILYARMSSECEKIRKQYRDVPDVHYFIQCSSGTPQMQMIWMVIRERGIIPATLISMKPRYYPGIGRPFATEVNFSLTQHIGDGLLKEYQHENDRLRVENERLRKEIERLSSGAHSAFDLNGEIPEGFNLTDHLRKEKEKYYTMAILKYPNNASEAARSLGLKPHTFRKEAEKMGLRPRNKSRVLQESNA